MGCGTSKLENEDTVRRCKDRRRLMKDAVFARHHLAAAHSDYCRSLRLTGSSLSSFASGEPLLSVSPHTPSVLLPSSSPLPPTRHVSPPPPRPQPVPPSASSSSFRATQYRKPPVTTKVKLPHILSESSLANTPRGGGHGLFAYKAEDMNYSETQSQTSSVWNWENFYPPSPPGSEYFQNTNKYNNNKNEHKSTSSFRSDSLDRYSVKSAKKDEEDDRKSSYNLKQEREYDINNNNNNNDKSSVYSDFFFDRRSNKSDIRSNSFHNKDNNNNNRKKGNHHLEVEEEEGEETEREEVQYSEWDDHYNSSATSSSSPRGGNDDDDDDERECCRSEIRAPPIRSDFGSERRDVPPEKGLYDDGASSVRWGDRVSNEVSNDRRMVVRHRDLVEIVAAIKEYFDKAASAGEQVAEMLETGRAQMDRSFSTLKKTVYHSSGMFTNLSSSWTSKPPLAVKYQFEPSSVVEPGGSKSLCSTLERLLAWEKKLYQEVKAREGVKIENEKKLSSLQSQECRGDNEVKLDKTKSEIKRLQSLIVVTSQAVSTTSSAIIGVRDAELVPQLVELCHGFMYMWRSMNQFHEVQNQIVQQVRGLVNQAMKGESTSDLHRQATRDLESAVSAWHASFCRLIKFQRDFICNLHGWFKLTLLPINTEPFNGTIENSEAFSFYDEWKLALERVPDTVASEAIKSFINVVHSISLKQTEEVKIKKRTESASKELEKKSSSLRNIEKKYYHSYSMVGIGLPDVGPDNGHVLDARDPLAEKKLELENCRRKVEDEMLRHSKAVEVTRAMTLNNIQTGLPGVFQAMTSFSALIMEALETVCTRSYAIK